MSNGWVCPIHHTVKFVPPGVSAKTGKAYQGFFCCAERGCEQRPPKGATPQAAPVPQRPSAPPPRATAPNWDKIAEGKCRSLALCAWISSGRELADFWVHERDFIAYMMSGKPPGYDERALDEQWDAMDPGPGDNDNIFGT